MDSLITAAGRALAAGDPLGALNRVALRDDAPALALRGIAMAQLGDLVRARTLVRRAAAAFGARDAVARARCVVAEAEIALAARDLGWPPSRLEAARTALESHGDTINAAHARSIAVRRLLLLGRLDDASKAIDETKTSTLSPATRAVLDLALAAIAMRRVHADDARRALARAAEAAHACGIAALRNEVERAAETLDAPAARLIEGPYARPVRLAEVEVLLASTTLVVDACRHRVGRGPMVLSLATRPVLFAIVQALGQAWPADVSREALLARAFGARHADESHRARLRVEVGRLRSLLRELALVTATRRGFRLTPHGDGAVAVLVRPVDEPHTEVLALLSDGEAWSSSGIALALGISQRSAQRRLDSLAVAGTVQPLGRGRTRRWTMPPMPGFATMLLLPTLVGGD